MLLNRKQLRLSPLRRAVGGTVLAAIVTQGLIAISGVISARVLGPEDRGYLALLIIFPSVIGQAGTVGVSLALTHYIARLPGAALALLRSQIVPVALQTVVLTGIHAAVALGYALDKPVHVLQAACVSLLSVPGAYLVEYGLAVLQGRREFRSLNYWRVAPTFGYVGALLVIVVSGNGSLIFVTAAAVASTLLIGVAIVFVAARRVSADRHKHTISPSDVPSRRTVYRFGVASYLGYVSPLEAFRIDQLLVGLMLGPVKLGLYVVAVAFMNLPRFIGNSLGLVAAPHLAATPGRQDAISAARRFVLAGMAVCGTIAVVIAATLQWILPLLFGESFEDAVAPGRILVLAGFFLAIRRIASDCARGLGLPAIGSVAELVSLGAFGVSAPLLASSMGVTGVALALAIGSLSGWLALMFIVRRKWQEKELS